MRRISRTLIVSVVLLYCAAISGCGAESKASADDLPSDAARQYSGMSDHEYTSVGQMVASSDLVVFGTVRKVEVGPSRVYDDGSNETSTTRLLVVEVARTLFSPSSEETASTIRVSDGYWVNGQGYESEDLGWVKVGDQGYFFVDRADDPQAKVPYYDAVSESGQVIVAADHLHFALTGVWDKLRPRDANQLQQQIDEGVEAARSGAAKPLKVRSCRPSIPDDESSQPICTTEES